MPRRRPPSPKHGSVQPAERYAGWLGCITLLHQERVYPLLRPYQQEVLFSLESGVDEAALAGMYCWFDYHTELLAKRGTADRPAKPRVEFRVSLTKKRNLTVEWEPAGLGNFEPGPDCDWRQWLYRPGIGDARPSNELLFVRQMEVPISRIQHDRHRPEESDVAAIDTTLVVAASSMIQDLLKRLRYTFEVQEISGLFLDWADTGVMEPSRLTGCEIENVLERTTRLEKQELEAFPKMHGCPVDAFMRALLTIDNPKRTGPAPAAHTQNNRISRELRKAGYANFVPSLVNRYRELLEKYRWDLFPTPPAGAKVMQLRPKAKK